MVITEERQETGGMAVVVPMLEEINSRTGSLKSHQSKLERHWVMGKATGFPAAIETTPRRCICKKKGKLYDKKENSICLYSVVRGSVTK